MVPTLGLSSSSASSEMSQTLGAPSKEPMETGRVVSGRESRARGLRVRFGEGRGDVGLASCTGLDESTKLEAGCMTVGSEWARAMGMADPLRERR